MGLIHSILDLVALLLWLAIWTRSTETTTTPATLAGTLRLAEAKRERRWIPVVLLLLLLGFRPVLYHELGTALNWTAQLNLVATRLSFKSDFRSLMLLYSGLSFLKTLGAFLICMILVDALGRKLGDDIPLLRLVRTQLGRVSVWPPGLTLSLPFLLVTAGWWLLSRLLAGCGLLPQPNSELTRVLHAALVGLGSYLAWKYLILTFLALNLLHNHVYFGSHWWWKLSDTAATRLLAPLRILPLRVARWDLTPLVGIILVLLVTHIVSYGLKLPVGCDDHGYPLPSVFQLPGLADWYGRISQ